MNLKMTRTGEHSKCISRADGSPIGQALELANGRWAPFDLNDRRLVETSISFASPKEVLAFFKAAEGTPQ